MALQAVITSGWHEQEDHTLRGGRRCWQQGGSDQQNDQEDELSCGELWELHVSLDVVNDAYSFFPIVSTMVKTS